MLENAFDLSPTDNNLDSPRLPHFAAGSTAPVALVYRVPAGPADCYNYLPQLSDELQTWVGADRHLECCSTSISASGAETIFTVQPIAASWPGDAGQLFLRLCVAPKP